MPWPSSRCHELLAPLTLGYSLSRTPVGTAEVFAGLRGRRRIGDEQWFFSHYTDVGAGDSGLTWQANLSAGYASGWGDLVLVCRYLYYDEGNDAFLQEMRVKGPLIGVSFNV